MRLRISSMSASQPDPWEVRCGDALAMVTSAALGGLSRDRAMLNVHLSDEAAATGGAQGWMSMKPPEEYPVSQELLERLMCDARIRAVVEGPDGSVLRFSDAQHPPPAMEQQVLRRDVHCGVPWCRGTPIVRSTTHLAVEGRQDRHREPGIRVLAPPPDDPPRRLAPHRHRRCPHLGPPRRHRGRQHPTTTTGGLTTTGRAQSPSGRTAGPPPRWRFRCQSARLGLGRMVLCSTSGSLPIAVDVRAGASTRRPMPCALVALASPNGG